MSIAQQVPRDKPRQTFGIAIARRSWNPYRFYESVNKFFLGIAQCTEMAEPLKNATSEMGAIIRVGSFNP